MKNLNDWKKITKEELEKYFLDGLFHKDIAKLYNVSWRAVYDKVKKFEIDLERKNKSKIDKTKKICSVCGNTYVKSPYKNMCRSCGDVHIENDFYQKATTDLGKQILELRKKGLSFGKISKQLKCSKATVSYYCTKNTKELTKKRHKYSYNWVSKFSGTVRFFKRRNIGKGRAAFSKDWNKKFRSSVSRFKLRKNYTTKQMNPENKEVNTAYTYKDALKYLGGTKVKCYLTGRPIDIEKDDYCLDHKIPVAKGGTNDLKNMGITCPEANASKVI